MVMRMLRGGGELAAVDFAFDVDSADPTSSELSVGQRNALIAKWVSLNTGSSLREAAADLPRLLGISVGRPRLATRFRPAPPDGYAGLDDLFEMELRTSARILERSAPEESLALFASQHGPFDARAGAARHYLLSRRLKALGHHTLAFAMSKAVMSGLDSLPPVAPIGPLRLQAERAAKDMASPPVFARLLDTSEFPAVPQAERDQALSESLLGLLLRADLVPRLIGTFRRPHQPILVIAFDHPAKSKQDLARLGLTLLDVLAFLMAEADHLAIVEPPLGIDLWLLRNGRLSRNIGWRELGEQTANVTFTKRTMIEFVEGPEANLPVAAVGLPYDAAPAAPAADRATEESVAADLVAHQALDDAMGRYIPWTDELAARKGTPALPANVLLHDLSSSDPQPEWGTRLGLSPFPRLPDRVECASRVDEVLSRNGLAHLTPDERSSDLPARLRQHYLSRYRNGLAMLLVRIVLGTYEDVESESGAAGYEILRAEGLLPSAWVTQGPESGMISRPSAETPRRAEGAASRGSGAVQQARVLIVDDIAETLSHVGRLIDVEPGLATAGQATTGLEAIEAVERLGPDVVLMDIHMPELDGITAAERIHEERPDLPIVVMSIRDDADTVRRAREAGACAYLVKPFSAEELYGALNEAIGRRRS